MLAFKNELFNVYFIYIDLNNIYHKDLCRVMSKIHDVLGEHCTLLFFSYPCSVIITRI